MNLIILATIIALSSAAQLPSRNYIPQNQGGGGYQGGQGGNYQEGSGGSYQGSGGFGGSGGGFGGSGGEGNTRPQQQQEKNAAVLKQDQAIDENSGNYHFGYETENGIRAEEQGNPSDAQGGFSYKGDDGITYTVTYSAGEGGFRPQGEHLPVAPPTPEAILEALQQNAKDEAAGIFDDGKYNPDVHGGPDAGGNKPGNGGFGGNGNRPNGNSGFGENGNGGFGGNGNSGFGGNGNGNHQNGFNNGYTY